jgi:DNA polymerase elongation subunit (family B)
MSELNPIEFQIYDWQEDHELDEDDDDDSDSSDVKHNDIGNYIIHTFGRTLDGKSVYMRVINYTPHFYIKLPLNWSKLEAKSNIQKIFSYFVSDMNKKIWKKYRECLISMDVVEKMAAEGFTNGKQYLFGRLIFNNMSAMKKYKFMFEESSVYIPGIITKAVQFKTYEANLPPMLRCFHIRKISGCSWVSVSKYTKLEKEISESYCDIELRVDWRDINPIEKDTNAPLRILSFDIECYSSDKDKFPQAKNKLDCIFQIGSTYTYLNESIPYRQHIVCLKETDPVEGSIVEWYEDEREMVRAWIQEIITQDCDIITGWNIFGFDEGYIYERCVEHLQLENEILYISKLKKHKCNFRDFKLESAAFGQNKIRMFDTPGRIHIDLMKDVQKNFKLNSYKLDSVSSNFIRNEIYKIEKNDDNPLGLLKLYCDGVDSIYKHDFIHVEYALDFISEMIGYKYLVEDINRDEKTLLLKPSDALLEYLEGKEYIDWTETTRKERKFKLFWSQAKDDVGPKDIFRMFNGTSAERAIVAKYCIKDCTLINLLIDKLCVVTNNIEMANVCYVPMSFLFTRGQLIKLFSLCLKNYRDAGYLFPVLKKPEEKTPSYEGAIVFDPEANVEYEALAVKDYASLYPSSIIHKNMSHETVIKLDKYDNIPDVSYFNAQFKDHDNSIQHRRFAKVGEELGVVPKTLRNLIAERNAVKKVMKGCKDPFKYKILDGKQLALKITANSLYGALGADVSPIFQRDIAACTTSTGREMLKLARHFDENIVPGLLNGYRYALYNGDEEKANKILEMEMKVNSQGEYDNELREKVKKYVMEDIKDYTFQPIIRYGDSVTGDTLVFIKYKNEIEIMNIKNLESYYKSILKYCIIGEKEYYKPLEDIYTYSDLGWTPIKYIMKHKTNKTILLIETTSGSVKVTEDHSCILNTGIIIKPTQLNIGDKLLTANIYDSELKSMMDINNINYENTLGIITGIKIFHSEEHNIKNEDYNNYVYDFETENHHFMAGDGNIVVHNTDSIFSCYRFREDTKQIKDTAALPLWKDIIAFSKKLLNHFLPEEYKVLWNECHNKYYNEDYIIELALPKGPIYKPPPSHYKNVPPLEERMEQFLLHYMEESFMPWLWIIQDIFRKKYVQKDTRENAIQMKLFNNGISMVEKINLISDLTDDVKEFIIEDVEYFMNNKLKDYIIQPYWDIDKLGNKIVRVRFYKHGTKIIDKRTLTLSIEMGVITGELVKKRLPFPHDLEYEKTFWPFLILTKKRYVGNKYEFNPDKYKQDYNGIVLKRRDNAPIVKEICGGIINRLIDDKDPDKARQFTIDCMNSMFNSEYNIKYFLTSKTLKLKESYADWTKIAHVVLADRISQRDPGNCPQSGDRIEFAAVQIPNVTKTTLQGERIETPQFIKDNNLKIDYEFYMTNQIMNPSLQFLSLVIPNAEHIFDEFKIRIENEKKGRSNIMNFIKKK